MRDFFELTYKLDVLPSLWKYFSTPKFIRLMKTLDELTAFVKDKVDAAVNRLDQSTNVETTGLSVLEKLLKVNRDVAIVMVFDMLMAGVDTVSSINNVTNAPRGH